MTTIAFRDGVLACDSMVSCNGQKIGTVAKAWTHRGVLMAGCGNIGVIQRLRDWVVSGMSGDVPQEAKDSEFLIAAPGHPLIELDPAGWQVIDAPFRAWGSGADYALGAMEMGATPEQAVLVASRYDTATGASVRVFHVGQ